MAETYNNLYLDARRALQQIGVEQAQLEARELLCHVSGKTREQFLRDLPLYAGDQVCSRFHELMQRRLAGEPVAYLIGEWDFYGLTLNITPDVLIPRSDTETLVEQGIGFLSGKEGPFRILDLCTGSGCIGLAMAKRFPDASVILADWLDGPLKIARQNVFRCDMSRQVNVARVNALEAPPPLLADFDLILCNPPYIPTADVAELDCSVKDYEPTTALDGGEDGLEFYRAVTEKWRPALRKGGMLAFEIGWDQSPAVEQLMKDAGYLDVHSAKDPGDHWRVVTGIAN